MKNRRSHISSPGVWCILALALSIITGCNYLSIPATDDVLARPYTRKENANAPVFNSAVIKGMVLSADRVNAATLIAAYRLGNGNAELTGYSVVSIGGPFMIYVPEGRYHLYALTDYDADGIFERHEISGVCGTSASPLELHVREGQLITGISIRTAKANGKALKLPASGPIPEGQNFVKQVTHNGQILKIYSDVYSPENAQTGYWHPSSFMKAFGAHIYFGEEYHPKKIPVLFVHGTEGSPHHWIYLWMRMDRTRYQPLFFYYPSGIRLSLAAALLDEELHELHQKFGFQKMVIIAHSVGGLTTRAFLCRYVSESRHSFVKLFISLATPWSGFEMADASQRLPHKSIPAWVDLGTKSGFIQDTMNEKLPPHTHHYILYGKNDKLSGDKAIDERAVSCAVKAFGFDCTHDSILSDRKVFARINAIVEKELR